MIVISIIIAAIVLLFGFVIFFGAPYLPTMTRQRQAAIDMLALKPGQLIYDLGCGDGRLLKAAAKRGLLAVGYELNPLLVIVARLSTLRYRKKVRIVWGNFWKADLKMADGVFVFLIDHHMARLDKFISSQRRAKSLKVVSYAFPIPAKKPAATRGPLFLYRYGPLANR